MAKGVRSKRLKKWRTEKRKQLQPYVLQDLQKLSKKLDEIRNNSLLENNNMSNMFCKKKFIVF